MQYSVKSKCTERVSEFPESLGKARSGKAKYF